ncbi:SMC-Scp complex subunit ScpB [Nocardioides jensenii]|uniref:SMC-Scp complex subunit ScpB n=1 Tax=Nocardioides jensenii TaxID=1843 RepID=UPI0009EBC761|nr:SMC-Scp complex subunit ScpB [Nocardioides jensenii]
MTDETGTPVSEAEDAPAEDARAEDAQADVETLDVVVAELRPSLEAILMVADQPLDQVTLASAVGHPVGDVTAALDDLAREYVEQGRGFELRNVAGGWRYYTRDEHAAVVEAFVLEGQQARLTQAALETLAVVAYKQPVSRARVSAIRGVNVDGVMRTLLTRGLVEEAGQDGETGANLYRTTTYFLERIGVTDITDLPELAPFLPDMADMEDDLAALAGGSDEAVAAVAAEVPTDPVAAEVPVDAADDAEVPVDAADDAEVPADAADDVDAPVDAAAELDETEST